MHLIKIFLSIICIVKLNTSLSIEQILKSTTFAFKLLLTYKFVIVYLILGSVDQGYPYRFGRGAGCQGAPPILDNPVDETW